VSFVEFLTAIVTQRARDLVEHRPTKSNILTSIGTVFSTTKYCLMELVSISHNCMESICISVSKIRWYTDVYHGICTAQS